MPEADTAATTAADTASTTAATIDASAANTANGAAATAATGQTDGQTAAAGQTSAAADWRAGLDGELGEFAKRVATPHDAIKVAYDLRKANSSMVRVPAADAKPEDVQRFRKAIGVPDKPEEYKPDLGRDLTEADKPVINAVAKVMFENGVPANAFTAVTKVVTELAMAQQAAANQAAEKARTDAVAALRKDWGADYDANLTLAQRAIKTFMGENADALLNTVVSGGKLGDHPSLVKAFGSIGRRMGEGEFIGAVGASEKASIQERIDQIMRENPPGSEKYKVPSVQRELSDLTSKLVGEGAGAGFPGRSV